jgi:ribonuclease HI
MTTPITLWLEISHHAAFRVGGWAYVRREPEGAVLGYAGGERRIDAERATLLGLIAALKDTRGATPVQIRTASPRVAAIPARLKAAQAGEEAPSENLELWAQLATALSAAPIEVVAGAAEDRAAGFAAAWAEVGRDRAKDKGNFTAAIPKPNLLKAGVG